MAILQFSATSAAGMIHLAIPVSADGNYDVQVTVSPSPTGDEIIATAEQRGWPPGFFEQYYGCIEDETFVAPERHHSEPEVLFE